MWSFLRDLTAVAFRTSKHINTRMIAFFIYRKCIRYEKLQLICNYFWQESSAGLCSVGTGTLWSRQPYPDHWSFAMVFLSCHSSLLGDGIKTQPPVDRRFRPVPLGFYCSKHWQPPRTGRNLRSTGGLVLKSPLMAMWYAHCKFYCSYYFWKSLYRRTWTLDNVCFRRNWRLIALFKAAKVSSGCSFKVCASFDYQMLSTVSLQIILQLELHNYIFSQNYPLCIYSTKCTES